NGLRLGQIGTVQARRQLLHGRVVLRLDVALLRLFERLGARIGRLCAGTGRAPEHEHEQHPGSEAAWGGSDEHRHGSSASGWTDVPAPYRTAACYGWIRLNTIRCG